MLELQGPACTPPSQTASVEAASWKRRVVTSYGSAWRLVRETESTFAKIR